LKGQVSRELDRLELLLTQIKAVEKERDAVLLAPSPEPPTAEAGQARRAPGAAMLAVWRGIAEDSATKLWSEGLSRHFSNRRQVASYAGLAATPWRSGSIAHEQGVSKAGNPRLRATMVQIAWLWLQHQPQSALARWYFERVEGRPAARKTTIVALARKLLVAFWKYVTAGVLIEGAVMKPVA
jgi:transposase